MFTYKISFIILLLAHTWIIKWNVTYISTLSLQAFGWAYVNKWHDTWDQFYVYWICPFIGAVAASMIFRVVFPPPAPARPAKKKKKN